MERGGELGGLRQSGRVRLESQPILGLVLGGMMIRDTSSMSNRGRTHPPPGEKKVIRRRSEERQAPNYSRREATLKEASVQLFTGGSLSAAKL